MSEMAKQYFHGGTKSWWSGKVTTWCGLVFDNPRNAWFGGITCPACKAIKKGR